jgi:hypothetical protein
MDGNRVQRWSPPRGRSWLAVAAAVLILIWLLPPAGTLARRYVLAESLQFVLFAVAVPALLALGAPWRQLGFTGLPGWRGWPVLQAQPVGRPGLERRPSRVGRPGLGRRPGLWRRPGLGGGADPTSGAVLRRCWRSSPR